MGDRDTTLPLRVYRAEVRKAGGKGIDKAQVEIYWMMGFDPKEAVEDWNAEKKEKTT